MENKKIICTNKDGAEMEANAGELKFRPGAYGIIIRDGKILMTRQWDGYDFPGGGVNVGEKIESALVREIKEETGFDVIVKELAACTDDFHKMTFSENFVQSILIYYYCEIAGGGLSKVGFDKNQFEDKYMELAEWVDLADISRVNFYNPGRAMKIKLLDGLSLGKMK